jgi:hypothetical protein
MNEQGGELHPPPRPEFNRRIPAHSGKARRLYTDRCFSQRQYLYIFPKAAGEMAGMPKASNQGVLPTLSATPADHRLLLGQRLLTSRRTPDQRNEAVPRDCAPLGQVAATSKLVRAMPSIKDGQHLSIDGKGVSPDGESRASARRSQTTRRCAKSQLACCRYAMDVFSFPSWTSPVDPH